MKIVLLQWYFYQNFIQNLINVISVLIKLRHVSYNKFLFLFLLKQNLKILKNYFFQKKLKIFGSGYDNPILPPLFSKQ